MYFFSLFTLQSGHQINFLSLLFLRKHFLFSIFKFVSSIFVKCIFQSYLFEIWLEIALKIWEIYRLQKVENKWISVYEVLKGCSWVTLTQMNHVYTFLNMKVTLWGGLSYSLFIRVSLSVMILKYGSTPKRIGWIDCRGDGVSLREKL